MEFSHLEAVNVDASPEDGIGALGFLDIVGGEDSTDTLDRNGELADTF